MEKLNDDVYRNNVRSLFERKILDNSNIAPHYKEKIMRAQQDKYQGYQTERCTMKTYREKSYSSGGDADRLYMESRHNPKPSNEIYTNSAENYMRSSHGKALQKEQTLPMDKYNELKGNAYELESNDGDSRGSVENVRSHKSSTTVGSRHSARSLRKVVKSQCALHEIIDETIKQMCAPESEADVPWSEHQAVTTRRQSKCSAATFNAKPAKMGMGAINQNANSSPQINVRAALDTTLTPSPQPTCMLYQCKCCGEKHYPQCSHKEVPSDFTRGEVCESHSSELFTIPVDDVVNSKVVNPMIRKLQHMYLNNLREEMSLLEDLERLPQRVNEVYKATILKRKN